MPNVGFSNPYIAKYTNSGAGKVSYSEGMRLGRGVQGTITIEQGGSNDFYADNKLAESSGGIFSGGTLSVSVAELTKDAEMAILGCHEEEIEVNGKRMKALTFDDDMKAPDLGYGDIKKRIINGAESYIATVLKKVKFDIPEETANTQGAEIEWQTQSTSAKIMKDDSPKHVWKMSKEFYTESDADAFIRHILNISNDVIEVLTVTSAAGTETGDTAITISEPLTEGRTYRYKVGADVQAPELYDNVSSWDTWNGIADIAAASGQTICIAEVDKIGLVMAYGLATVVAKE